MNSFFLLHDPEPARDLKANRKSNRLSAYPFFGIFSEDPINIANGLPRPITPFISNSPSDSKKIFDHNLTVSKINNIPIKLSSDAHNTAFKCGDNCYTISIF